MNKQRVVAESILANSAYFSLLLFAMSRGVQSGVIGLAIVASACKASTVVAAGLLATSSLGVKRVWPVLFVSQVLAVAFVGGYFLTPLGEGAWWALLPLMVATSTLQVFENNLRSKSIGGAASSGASVSPKTYIRSTQGALVLSSLVYLAVPRTDAGLPPWSVPASIALCLVSSMVLKLPELIGRPVPATLVPIGAKVSLLAGMRIYRGNSHRSILRSRTLRKLRLFALIWSAA